jgi:hypothetical protein
MVTAAMLLEFGEEILVLREVGTKERLKSNSRISFESVSMRR